MTRALLLTALLGACKDEPPGSPIEAGHVPYAAVKGLSWELHPDFESLVIAHWSQEEQATVHVEFSFDYGEVHSTPAVDAAPGEHQLLLAGIPYETSAEWAVVAEDGTRWEGSSILTGNLPEDLPLGEVTVSEPAGWIDGGNYLLTSINSRTGGWTGGTYWAFIIDRQARVVWAHETPEQHWTLYTQVAMGGDYFFWDEATYWAEWDDGEGSTVHRVWLDGEFDEVSTPGLHHAFIQLPGEMLAWGSQAHGGGEALVEMPLAGGDQTVLWTCVDDWDRERYCESNCLWYSEERDSYLYSFYTNSTVVEIDRSTGENLWWAGEKEGGYSFAEGTPQFSWQHGVTWTEAGTLLVSSEAGERRSQTTEAYEYAVDHEQQQLTLVWDSDANIHADTNGDTWRLDNGNTLHMVGSSGVLREVDPEGEDLWRVDFDGTYLLGRGQFIEDLYDLVSPDGKAGDVYEIVTEPEGGEQ